MGKVWDSSCRRVRGCLQTVATQAEYGFFAHMQPLAQMKQMFEGSKVALQMQWPKQASQLHGLALAVGVTLPVEPAQMPGVESYAFGLPG